jgi:hypothetical protein
MAKFVDDGIATFFEYVIEMDRVEATEPVVQCLNARSSVRHECR